MIGKLGIGTVARRALLSGALATGSLDCGNAPPPAPIAPRSTPAAANAILAAPEIAELTEPSHVVGILRWRNPNATLETVYRWTGIRLAGSDLLAQVLDPGLANALTFDAPVDAVVALDPRATTDVPLMAVSVGVPSLDAARRAFQTVGPVTEIRPGEFRVGLRHDKKNSDPPACLLMSARGAAAGRLICAKRDHDVDALRGYMARTLPERNLGDADVHLEIHASPAVELYAPMINQGLNLGAALLRQKLELGEPTFDRTLGAAFLGMSEELRALLGDLDTINVDLELAPERARASVALYSKGQRSWTAGTLSSQASHAATAPAMFWSLPATSTTAGYTFPPEHERFDALRRTLGELLEGYLAHEGVTLADRAPLVALFGDKYVSDSAWVTASGPFEPGPGPKPAAKIAAAVPPTPLQAAIDGFGWYLAGVATPNQTPEFVKSVSTAASRPKLQAMLRSKLALLMASGEENDTTSGLPTGFTFKSTGVPKALPKGSLAFELAITPESPHTPRDNKKPAAKPLPPAKLQVLVVSESARTWVILGSDKAELTKIALAATEAAPLAAKLASRTDLSAMKDGKYTSASFATLQSFLASILGGAARMSLDLDPSHAATEARTMLESTPNRGKTPILMTSEIGLDNGITWRARFDVPKGVIEDAIVLAASSRLMLPRP